MQLEDNIELSLEEKKIEKQILSIFQEIKEGYLVDCNDILEDLNPLMSQLGPQDKNKVVQALNKYFRDHEFVRNGGYWLQGTFDLQEEIINYTLIYNQDRITKNYQSILDKMRVPEFRRQNLIPEFLLIYNNQQS